MAKKKKKLTSSSNNILTYIAWTLAAVALIMTALLAGYYLGYEDASLEYTGTEKEDFTNKIKRLVAE